MATRIRYLPMEEVTDGMVLGAPLIVTDHGVTSFMLPSGHVLTESNMAQIAQRNAEWACIEEADSRSDDERAADLSAIRMHQEALFARSDRRQPAVASLFEAVLKYRSL